MSGHKIATITISQEEYRKLYEAEKKISSFPNSDNLSIYDFQASPDETLFDQMNRFYGERASHVHVKSDISRHPKFSQQKEEIHQLAVQQIDRIHKDVNKISEDSLAFEKEHRFSIKNLTDQMQDIREEMNRVTKSLIDVTELISKPDDIQYEFTNAQNELNEYIEEIISFEKPQLVPEEKLKRLLDIREECTKLVQIGRHEPAMALTIEALIEARDIFRQVHADLTLWTYEANRLNNRVINILRFLVENSTTQAVTRDGVITDILLDLDEWSENKYSIVLDNMTTLSDWFFNNWEHLDFENLAYLEKSIQSIVEEYEDCVSTAHRNAINSQLKVDIARQIMYVLIDQGYRPTEGNYVNLEGNEGYYTQAENGEGSIVQVILEDDPRNRVGNRLSLVSLDHQDRTEYELGLRAKIIRDAIQDTGLVCSPLKEPDLNTGSTNQRRGDLRNQMTTKG